jgi:hypothetical protein
MDRPRQPSPRPIARSARGQSLVETVVFLPVLVVIFLGMFYLKGLMDTKMRAVEAARYVTWEHTWIPREGMGKDVAEDNRDRAHKTDAQLKTELEKVGLGAYLFRVQGPATTAKNHKESLGDYSNRVKQGALPLIVGIPAAVTQLFGNSNGFSSNSNTGQFSNNPDSAPGTGGGSTSGSGPLSGLGLGNGLQDLLNVISGPVFFIFDRMGHQTKWGTESDESVLTTQVVYKYAAGGTTIFRPRFVEEHASILSHPFNIKRSDDQEEHHRLAGDGASFQDENNIGHIFDLWLFPSGEPKQLRFAKAPFAAISNITNFLSSLNPFSSSVPLRIPNGTLKEYPEMDLPTSAGNAGGNSSGSGLGGGNSTPLGQ